MSVKMTFNDVSFIKMYHYQFKYLEDAMDGYQAFTVQTHLCPPLSWLQLLLSLSSQALLSTARLYW